VIREIVLSATFKIIYLNVSRAWAPNMGRIATPIMRSLDIVDVPRQLTGSESNPWVAT
jgi:hypothetical protein